MTRTNGTQFTRADQPTAEELARYMRRARQLRSQAFGHITSQISAAARKVIRGRGDAHVQVTARQAACH